MAQNRQGAIVELRALKQNVGPEDWKALAKSFFRMTVALNQPGKIYDFFFKPRKPAPPKLAKWAVDPYRRANPNLAVNAR